MTHYYSYSSLNYSMLTIVVRWCVFYCIWNLWTLPRLESSNERIDVSIRAHGNNNDTIFLQESLPVHTINGHKTVLISKLLEDARIASETKPPMKLRQPKKDGSLVHTDRELQYVSNGQYNNRLPLQRKSVHSHRMPRKETQTQSQTLKFRDSLPPTRLKKLRSKTMTMTTGKRNTRRLRSVPRTSSFGESYIPFDQSPKYHTTSTFVLLVFSGALVGGGIFAVRGLKRLEKWENQTQEDSLAYDIAYTSRSESSYGSFEQRSWQDDLSKFDV